MVTCIFSDVSKKKGTSAPGHFCIIPLFSSFKEWYRAKITPPYNKTTENCLETVAKKVDWPKIRL